MSNPQVVLYTEHLDLAAIVRFEARPDVNIVAIICGLIILAIAEVFRERMRLDEEQSLTI